MISGVLYVVATPIGNLDDFSLRAAKILAEVNLVLTEDTRQSSVLLNHFGITTPVVAFHEHNEFKTVNRIINRLLEGDTIALISDAGTPLINDPGYVLITMAHKENIKVIPVPGPSAVIAALSVSGLPTDRFVYEGFLPARTSARRKRLMQLMKEERTLIFYEVPHRICECLEDMIDQFGWDREATLAKEMTKYHENIRKDSLVNLLNWLTEDKSRQKGEFVLLVAGSKSQEVNEAECIRVLNILLGYMSKREAASVAAKILGDSKNRMYQLALDIGNKK